MEGDNVEKPLLERKKYFENCPGCKVDKAKELSEGQGVPFTNLFIIWMVVLCACEHFHSALSIFISIPVACSICFFQTVLSKNDILLFGF